ncbi:MAG: hypothetical protein HY680_08260 [Chloroflexi bacterium]|nr:hypothetical protein [Chloroflexota bacterium]
MATNGGFTGKMLYVDLSTRKIEARETGTEEELRMWVGCSGLGLHLLASMIRPGMEFLEPDSPMILINGPLTGTAVPQSSNWAIVNLRQQAGYHPGFSFGHGFFGARLKHAGWDGIVVVGASPSPVYLWIDDSKVEIQDASKYWGTDTFACNRKLREDLGDPQRISVACIGPGGEELLAGGVVRADLAYSAGTAAPGTLWGSKKLKAIAVRGTGLVPLAHPGEFLAVANEWRNTQWNHKVTPEMKAMHTVQHDPRYAKHRNPAGQSQPVKNMSEYLERGGAQPEEGEWKFRPVGSFNCEMACHFETNIPSGPFAGLYATGYSPSVIGSMHGIYDRGIAMGLTTHLDELGLHESEVPSAMSMVMEAYNTERLTQEQCNGLDLSWGNWQSTLQLLDMTLHREGIGAIIAKGIKATAEELGLQDLAVHIKGSGFHGQYQINHPAMLFASVVAGGGPRWEVSNRLFLTEGEPDLGYEAPLNPDDPTYGEVAAKAVYEGQKKKTWEDDLGVCYFAMQGYTGIFDLETRSLMAATGWTGFTRDEAMMAGERFINLQRMVSLYLGYKPEFDYDVSQRLMDAIPTGPGKGRSLKKYFDMWRDEYYQLLGWSTKTGAPSRAALRRVGLQNYMVGK